jgi:CBS domain-containing protein
MSPVLCSQQVSAVAAAHIMRDREVRDVVVVEDEGELVGILTDRLDVTRPRPRSMRS